MNLPEKFGENVFNDAVQKERLPKEVYKSLRATIEAGTQLDVSIAGAVAAAMKDWAVSKGATHYTHWFQPLTGLTAEKHDSFIEPEGDKVIMRLTGKSLIVGEPDASSFPSGGSRATYMARGYTAWDPTSPAFVKGTTLYIPSIFVSYTGETLDKKSPILKSMKALDMQAKRILKLFGVECKKVTTTVGPEQEYFLISEEEYFKRIDLRMTGRTLFGAPVLRGQELEDHYFGTIKPTIADFMADLDETLWSFGIPSKTRHNEVAPAQHEMAPVYATTNVAIDENMLTMELMKKVAQKHGLICLLHEKPFDGINGSGKHNNWSMSTDTGLNLLDPGPNPEKNTLFMVVLAAVIDAVDEYQGILRGAVASAGNDHRLGANEAPPAIISIYLGDQLGELVDSIANGRDYVPFRAQEGSIGVPESPIFPKDASDRNRTSPFAFTGNKFEFRMLGSNQSISDANIVLNTAVAEELKQFADELEGAEDFTKTLNEIIRRTIKEHKRIIFNGDGYADAWQEEAAKRGLLNYKTAVEAIPHFVDEKNVKLFTSHNVFTEKEMISRTDILLEIYSKTINIEALTLIDMVKKDILPAISAYTGELASTLAAKLAVCEDVDVSMERAEIKELSGYQGRLYALVTELDVQLENVPGTGAENTAVYYRDTVVAQMQSMREVIDAAEQKVSAEYWPVPTYLDIIFRV